MAQFRATIKGQRGMASRLGSKASGLDVTANGWDDGVRVAVSHRDGRDHFEVYRTGGSKRGKADVLLASFAELDIPSYLLGNHVEGPHPLTTAARRVVACWERGDLASAVRALAEALANQNPNRA